MAESITISTSEPPLKSMNYTLLRELGLQHIQRLSGKLWSDNNAHDPGITMLEVLAYAITDLGYRTNYDIKDILTPNPVSTDIRNFFTAAQILPNCPVTYNDYRKLLIDVECEEVVDSEIIRYGVRNAWIEKTVTECPFYVNEPAGKLDFNKPVISTAINSLNAAAAAEAMAPVALNPLYNVLIELDTLKEEFGGDLNENTIEGQVVVKGISDTDPDTKAYANVNGTVIDYVIEFPRWDTPGIDWYSCNPSDEDATSIRSNAKSIDLSFSRLPDDTVVDFYNLDINSKLVTIVFKKRSNLLSPPEGATAGAVVSLQLNELIYGPGDPHVPAPTSAITIYQKKVQRVLNVIAKVKATLMENRNLCEDFVKISAVKVEEIALCADIETAADADLEEVNAQIYHQVARFLAPTVYFYTLDEMFAKGKTTDEMFEGPRLEHGFIDDAELTKAERRSVIHVSDLISIIMDIPGVLAVKSIQIGNIPLDNDDNIESKTVRWCLQLAIAFNYVPRLSIEHSKLTFYKDGLPFRAKAVEVKQLIEDLEQAERPQKQHDIPLDLPVPTGEYKDIENYFSLQEEFPLIYGIGSPGLPGSATNERKGQAKELKAYLLFFEQILANYLSQLFHVKDMFSMNDEIDPITGDPVINRTYFSQSLMSLVPDAAVLYFDQADPAQHAADLQQMTEDEETFLDRRNRILDHLAGRFAESFSDYALLVYTIDGKKAPEDLIADKLAFLNNYPLISSARDKGFNYKDPCELWHVDNPSGLERRASFLSGIDRFDASHLIFSDGFTIEPEGSGYTFQVDDGSYVLRGTDVYATKDEAKYALEHAIINGSQREKYVIAYNDKPIPPGYETDACYDNLPVNVWLLCNGVKFAQIVDTSDPSFPPYDFNVSMDEAIEAITLDLLPFIKEEFLNNPESNRYNFACFFEKYVEVAEITEDDVDLRLLDPCPPEYTLHYKVKDETGEVLFAGDLKGQANDESITDPDVVIAIAQENEHNMILKMLESAALSTDYSFAYNSDPVEIANVLDRCGNVIGELTENDFGAAITADLNALTSVEIIGSTQYDGTYTLAGAVADNPLRAGWLDIPVSETLAAPLKVNGFVTYTSTISITSYDVAERTFKVTTAGNLRRILFPGEEVSVDAFATIEGKYTVLRVEEVSAGVFLVHVKQAIIATGTQLTFVKRLSIVNVDEVNGIFTVAHGADLLAVKEVSDWVNAKFFSHEGMHIVEHILLRPKCKFTTWDTVTKDKKNGLVPVKTEDGKLALVVRYRKIGVKGYQLIVPDADLTSWLYVLQPLKASNDNTLSTFQGTVKSFLKSGKDTVITTHQAIPASIDGGDLLIQFNMPVYAVDEQSQITIDMLKPGEIATEFAATYSGSNVGNNGSYQVKADTKDPKLVIVVARLAIGEDHFLPIKLGDECEECNYRDPYSYIATVILPAWQGRFTNQSFRRFFERTLRLECPAHILLNICWIECEQMEAFELKYKTWLLENARENQDRIALSNALNEFLEVFGTLRSVFPAGTLHDCENDDVVKNSVILNNSILGTL